MLYRSDNAQTVVQSTYSDWLRHWPLTKEEHTLPTRHGDTFVIASGSDENPPLILLHPPGLNSIVWINDVETYCKSHRVYAVDIPGQPGRSGLRPIPLTANLWLEWLDDVISGLQLQLKQIALLGVSIGGWAALQFAAERPDLISRVAVISPLGIVSRRWSYGVLPFFCGPFARYLRRQKMYADPELDKRVQEFTRQAARYCKLPGTGAKKIPPKILKQIYCPVMVMSGGRDKVQKTDALLLKLIKNIPQIEIVYRKNGGHMLGSFAREMDRFLLTEYVPD